ncbi:MAG: magnesium/cobalt transporter CorA [Bacteroidia bacterium]|nr:magnesium/cobalt transporter CorA [Bacteroidia bacterium]MDW8348177.1 magnesium/cobalt transporter CorA [Bacteroidia bacterium]
MPKNIKFAVEKHRSLVIIISYKNKDKIMQSTSLTALQTVPISDMIWVDLYRPTPEEQIIVEEKFETKLHSRQETEEIQSSARYEETDTEITCISNFLTLNANGTYFSETVAFILKNQVLISYRNSELRTFAELYKRMQGAARWYSTGYHVLVSIFELRIDLDADLTELLAKEVANLTKNINIQQQAAEDTLFQIAQFQENTMVMRENIIDKQRVISAILKSDYFPEEIYPKLRVMIKDIGSLLDHARFNFERLEYLQNTVLGLINLEQNKVIKIFTVASVIFMPPTLIASIYGMNFDFMPELKWLLGYPFALLLMILSSALTLFIFKRKKWL